MGCARNRSGRRSAARGAARSALRPQSSPLRPHLLLAKSHLLQEIILALRRRSTRRNVLPNVNHRFCEGLPKGGVRPNQRDNHRHAVQNRPSRLNAFRYKSVVLRRAGGRGGADRRLTRPGRRSSRRNRRRTTRRRRRGDAARHGVWLAAAPLVAALELGVHLDLLG